MTARDELAAIVRDWLADITSSTYADGSIFVEGAVDLDPYTIADAIIAAGWRLNRVPCGGAPENQHTRPTYVTWTTSADADHAVSAPDPCQHPADRVTRWTSAADLRTGGRCADCGAYVE